MTVRRRRDPKFPGAGKRELRRRSLPPAKPWTFREKLVVSGSLALAVAVFCFPYFGGLIRERKLAASRVDGWRETFKLDQSQVRRLLDLEHEYHGTGNPFAPGRRFFKAQSESHNHEIAEIMGPEAGPRFLTSEAALHHSHFTISSH